MVLTGADKKILEHVDQWGGITIKQAAKIFYPSGQFAYDSARMKLKKISKLELLQTRRDPYLNELVYFKSKEPSTHRIALLNLYAEYIYCKVPISHFQGERYFANKRHSDGFIAWDNGTQAAFIEVDLFHETNVKKYEDLFEVEEYQQKYGMFPHLIILSITPRHVDSKNFTVINMDLKCTDFVQKVLAL
jgi:hypothetical protein